MLFIIIGLVFLLIAAIAFFGDYESKEMKNGYKKIEEIRKNKKK